MDLLSNMNRLNEKDRLYIPLAMLADTKHGAILGLQYADIDRDGGWIRVRRNVTRPNMNKPTIGIPKSKKGYRSIPILAQLSSLCQAATMKHLSLERRNPCPHANGEHTDQSNQKD